MLQLSGANRGTRVVRAPDVEGGDPVPERLEGPHMAGQHLYRDGNNGDDDDRCKSVQKMKDLILFV